MPRASGSRGDRVQRSRSRRCFIFIRGVGPRAPNLATADPLFDPRARAPQAPTWHEPKGSETEVLMLALIVACNADDGAPLAWAQGVLTDVSCKSNRHLRLCGDWPFAALRRLAVAALPRG